MLLELKECPVLPALPALAVPNSNEDWLLYVSIANVSCMLKLLLHSLTNVQQPDPMPYTCMYSFQLAIESIISLCIYSVLYH